MATRGAKKRLQNIFKQWSKEYDYSIPTEEWRDEIFPDTGGNTTTNLHNSGSPFTFGHPGKLGKKGTKKLSKSQKRKLKKEAQRAGKNENKGAVSKEKKKEKQVAVPSDSQASKGDANTNGKKGTKNVNFPDNCASIVGTADDYDRTPSMDIPSFFCDGCRGAMSIIDQRFHCTKCPDFDLCPGCFSVLAQSHPHPFNCITPTLDEDGEIMAEIDENIQAGDTEGEFTAEDEQEMREAFLNEYLASADPEELGVDMDLFKNGFTSSLGTDDGDEEDDDSGNINSLAGLAGLEGDGGEDDGIDDGTEIRTEFMFEQRRSSVRVEEITDEEFSRLLASEKAKVESKEGETKGGKKKLAKKKAVLIQEIAPIVTEDGEGETSGQVLSDSTGETAAMTVAEEGGQKNTKKRNRKQKAPRKKQLTPTVSGKKKKGGENNSNTMNNSSEKQEENKNNKKNNKKRKNNNDNKMQNQKNSKQKNQS